MVTRIILALSGLMMVATMSASAAPFKLTSPTLPDGSTVPMVHVFNGMGYHGQNRSPALAWSGAPAGTKSFAVTCHDPDAPSPDAPRPGGWWHWLAFDIPAGTAGLPENASAFGMPPGSIQSVTDFGPPGYGGPAPPPGKPHRYVFTVYALKIDKLGLGASDSMTKVDAAIRNNALASASFTVKFGHP
ncbi:kinase inhibitor [Rhizomicrobium electricum]|uniref:Kinase inhibitor n=2 Tax=Rhizomicrobium electricum TaxID=480070 RepID=A0ABP3QFZ8_9PROT